MFQKVILDKCDSWSILLAGIRSWVELGVTVEVESCPAGYVGLVQSVKIDVFYKQAYQIAIGLAGASASVGDIYTETLKTDVINIDVECCCKIIDH